MLLTFTLIVFSYYEFSVTTTISTIPPSFLRTLNDISFDLVIFSRSFFFYEGYKVFPTRMSPSPSILQPGKINPSKSRFCVDSSSILVF